MNTSSSASGEITHKNAMSYLEELEKALSQPKFAEFLTVIEDFKEDRMTTQEVVIKVQSILSGKSSSLITGFNMFLPVEYHIKPQKFDVAMGLVKKIRERFEKTKPQVLASFVDILARFQDDTIPLSIARSKVQVLFQGQTDLLEDFDNFLPLAEGPSSQHASAHSSASQETQQSSPSKKPLVGIKSVPTSRVAKSTSKSSPDKADSTSSRAAQSGATGVKRKAVHSGQREEGGAAKSTRQADDAGRRRLSNLTRPHPGAGAAGDGQRLRKQPFPRKFVNPGGPCAKSGRRKLFRTSDLASVIPLAILQRAQTLLRTLHS